VLKLVIFFYSKTIMEIYKQSFERLGGFLTDMALQENVLLFGYFYFQKMRDFFD
jgi:hypothetical protein